MKTKGVLDVDRTPFVFNLSPPLRRRCFFIEKRDVSEIIGALS